MEQVLILLHSIEEKYDVTVLYAVEAGSRAVGLDREGSDYDVRFVYCYNKKAKYVCLHEPKETISGFSEDRLYDWQGWDVKKSLSSLHQSNPSIVEWLYSPIVYVNRNDFVDLRAECRSLLESAQRRVSLIYHYASMARKNFNVNVDKNERVSPKKYIHTVRGVLMMEWQFLQSSMGDSAKLELVELSFPMVLADLETVLPTNVFAQTLALMEARRDGTVDFPRLPELDEFIQQQISTQLSDRVKTRFKDKSTSVVDPFDELLMKVFDSYCT